jgi:2,4-dienoyl-CoA reductase (NADPH2)
MTRETPRELSVEEIKQIIEAFAQAALRVKKAGFDALEVLSGTGYLISQFLSPLTNQRKGEYGGPLENRMRFGLEIIRSIRQAVGRDFPLLARMNGNDFMPGGQGPLELREYAKALVQEGVDALDINVGWHEARVPQIVSFVPRGVFAYLARGIKKQVSVPVIAGHRINDPALARQLIGDGMCDLVAMGRSLIADPYLPEKARTGREDEIVHCVACAQGCFDHLFELKSIECLCNPKAGRESQLKIEKTKHPKKIMVIGGGPAGMSAALAAHERGHSVTIYERSDRLGGQLFLAGAPPGRQEFLELAKDLQKQIRLKGIRVVLNQTVDEELIERERPDAVVVATGAVPMTPPIPGIDRPHVVQAWDVLEEKVITGRRVVVIGGGAVGVETALFLADKGTLSGDALKFLLVNKAEEVDTLYELATHGTKEVVLIEMISKVGKDIGRSTRWGMLQDLSRYGVKTDVETRAIEITDTGVKVERGKTTEEIPADTVVLAGGAQPFNPLEPILEKKGIPYKVAGDARQVGTAFEAVHQGFAVAGEI